MGLIDATTLVHGRLMVLEGGEQSPLALDKLRKYPYVNTKPIFKSETKMTEPWTCTQDHEAAHVVIAWINAERIEVIGDLVVTVVDGRRVAVAGVRAQPHLISPRNAAKVGVSGFLGEARGVVNRSDESSEIVGAAAIAQEVIAKLTEFLSGLAPTEEAWRMHVEVRPAKEQVQPVFTLDDLQNVGAWANSENVNLMTELVSDTIQEIHTPKVWDAICQISKLIPNADHTTLSRQQLRGELSRLLPRRW